MNRSSSESSESVDLANLVEQDVTPSASPGSLRMRTLHVVSAGGNGDGVFDEANPPVRVVCKAAPEAFSIGFDVNGWSAATFCGNNVWGIIGRDPVCIVGAESRDELGEVSFDRFGGRVAIDRLGPCG